MRFAATPIAGLTIIDLPVFSDERGYFVETYQQRRFAEAGITALFVQDNHSSSQTGVLRGLHFQIEQPQGKLIQVVRGEIYDAVVDLRRSSPTFGRWFGLRLQAVPRQLLYVPPGCAHGFYVIAGPAEVSYKCTDFYAPQHERTLLWSDPAVGIEWPLTSPPVVSAKDQQGRPFAAIEAYP